MALSPCRFGSFRLLPQARELWRGDTPITLPPRVFDCLVYLVEHRERAVGRDELIAAVWGRTETSDTTVAQTILRIRRTLGEDEAAPRGWIGTVPRFGYRWIAVVESIADEPASIAGAHALDGSTAEAGVDLRADAPAVSTAPAGIAQAEATSRARGNRRALLLVAALLLLVAIGIAAWLLMSEVDAPATVADAAQDNLEPGWLVLPVASEGGAAPDWIRLGIMDAIAQRLRRAGLPVLPSAQTLVIAEEFARAGQPADIGSLRRTSGSRLVVVPQSGSDGDQWRITLSVHDPDRVPALYRGSGSDALAAARQATAALLAARGLEGIGATDVGPRDELMARVEAAMLAGRLGDAEALLVQRPGDLDDDPLAVLKLAQVRDRRGRGNEALALVDTVLERPDLDPAIRGLALIRVGAAHVRAGRGPEAETAFRAALAALPEDRRAERGEAWNGIGIGLHMQGKIQDAAAGFARSRSLFAHSGDRLGHARALNNQGLLSMGAGQPLEGLARFLEAEPVMLSFGGADEQSSLQQSIAWSRLFLGQYHDADEVAQRAVQIARRTENPLVKRQSAGLAARIAIRVGDLQRAQQLIDTLAALPIEQRYSLDLYRALLAEAQRDWPAAIGLATVAQDSDDLDREGRGDVARILLEAGLATGDASVLQRALASFAKQAEGDESGRWQRWQQLAQARIDALSVPDSALARLRDLWADTLRLRVAPMQQIEIGLALANLLLDREELGNAETIADQLSPWLNEDHRVALLEARLAGATGDEARRQAALAHLRQLARERPLPNDI